MNNNNFRQVTISLEEYLMLRDFKKEMFRAFTLKEVRNTADLFLDVENEAVLEIFQMLEMDNRRMLADKKEIYKESTWNDNSRRYLFEYAKQSEEPVALVEDDFELDLSQFEEEI